MSAPSDVSTNQEAQWIVAVTEADVSCTRPGGVTESIGWDELKVVAIETTDQGPFMMDVFWLLMGDSRGCVIPQGATGEDVLMKKLQQLPGFDNEMVIQAMMSTENRRFICWQKAAAP